MKVHRAPRKGGTWSVTDARSIADFAKTWKPGSIMELDATIKKSGTRHSAVGVQFQPEDIAAMAASLFAHYETREKELTKAMEQLGELLDKGRREGPSVALLKQIERIVSRHRWAALEDL